ncbi:hypothetical protein [Enhydrobacter sp.]|uniref:hypothetical protein n=1 Tax=Enhydrobacter sp. TaxID=1894999 RepID=UPI002637399F|nr:hypothetical protein [Enhydrobacter sp.]WIM13534.1 MAG: hypothetical protein OJF58_004502 [Enhydrobacter sp.]
MPSKKPTSAKTKRKLDDKLDQALEDTFPASDPVSFVEPSSDEEDSKESGGKDRKLDRKR